MKDHPILFNSEMVKAILEGRKTQTRRVVKLGEKYKIYNDIYGKSWVSKSNKLELIPCPIGMVGDRLWVRETTEADNESNDSVILSRYTADKKPVLYSACDDKEFDGTVAHWDYGKNKRPSIYMQRWASRITLEITDIRVEKIQNITTADAITEGIFSPIPKVNIFPLGIHHKILYAFRDLWNHINEKRGFGWDENPWVWVVEFKRVGDK